MKRFSTPKLLSLLLILAMLLFLPACTDLGEVAQVVDQVAEYVDSATEDEGAFAPENQPGDEQEPTEQPPADSAQPQDAAAAIDEDGVYTSREDVALYLYTYSHLPDNFITKDEAKALGWEGGSLEPYASGCCIGGDRFGNREGLLPAASGRSYTECDIDTMGASSRGAKRIVFSNDGLIYYTDDHYESFTLLYGEE